MAVQSRRQEGLSISSTDGTGQARRQTTNGQLAIHLTERNSRDHEDGSGYGDASRNHQQQYGHGGNSSAPNQLPKEPAGVQMRRSLGVWNGIAIIIGVIVGSGIFVSPRGVLSSAGSVGASLVVWALCGLLALLGALCFAELGTSIGSSGGEFTYINMAYGPLASYLYIWVLVLIIMPCSNAISALTFANYCLQPLYKSDFVPPEEAIRLLALAILMLLIYINCVTLDGTIKLQTTFTVAKVLALGLIIAYGFYHILTGNRFESLYDDRPMMIVETGTSKQPPPDVQKTGPGPATSPQESSHGAPDWWAGTQTSLPLLARAFYSGFFTYSGWSTLNSVTEEIKEPHKNMPRAIVFSISSVTLIYILANGAYFAVLSKEEILSSDAIAVLFCDKAFSFIKWLMPLMVALSTLGGLNASIFAASRVYYAAGREGQLFNALAMINSKELTPIPSLIFLGLTSVLYLTTTKISQLIDYTTFIEASFAALAVSTMLALRRQQPKLKRPLKVPQMVPIVYLLISALFVLLPLWSAPWESAIGIGITLTGLPAYYLTAKWENKPAAYQKLIDKFNVTVQKITMSEMPTPQSEHR